MTASTENTAPKNIVVLSDGTGNSSAKLFKTNVWRLYQAVDVANPPPQGQPLQVVAYDDGVGTSSFKPLALLGGAFGVGLKRNVLELYQFVCRSYEKGDRIYAFGFSRGAFTIRVLVGMLTSVGIIDARGMDHAVLNELSEDAYRQFRRAFRLSGTRHAGGGTGPRKRDRTDLIVTPLRGFRDRRIARKRRKAGREIFDKKKHIAAIPDIAFVGVWDTVAAYGSPIAEITKGIDRWVWPLSMPDYTLSDKVQVARHALALDDERDTFHPLLWDEVHERDVIKRDERLKQVWFAGMHSDVGGGYPDDSLACVSLVWMAEEAIKAGLRLQDDELDDIRARANPFAPMHNSRSGLGAYYRYQPRKISGRLEKPDSTTRILQDPDMKGRGLLTTVRIHDSVLERIQNGPDGYAPIVLPADYVVEGGPSRELYPAERAEAQETVWDLVWRRRVHYFATLGLTLALLSLALFPDLWPNADSTCTGPQCFISPWLRAAGGFLPSFASSWVDSFADSPGTFLALTLGIAWLMRKTGKIELQIRDAMRQIFRLSLPSGNDQPDNPSSREQLQEIAKKNGFIRWLRSCSPYQAGLQYLKWRLAPGGAAIAIYFASVVLAVTFLSSVVSMTHRTHLVWVERFQTYCGVGDDRRGTESDPPLFSTSDMCWRVPGEDVRQGQRYRLRIDVETPWIDTSPMLATTGSHSWSARMASCFTQPVETSIPASPAGFDSDRFKWCVRWPATLLRRSTSDPWFRPLISVQRDGSMSELRGVPIRLVDYDEQVYVGEFTAPADGKVMLSVNDAVFLWAGKSRRDFFYKDNAGTARVTLEPCMKHVDHPCDFSE